MTITLQYGSGTGSPEIAAEELRQVAAANGIKLRPAERVDLAAAAYAADQWCQAFRTRTLAYPAVHGQGAVRALAAILSRASGRRHVTGRRPGSLPRDDTWEALTAELTVDEQWDAIRKVVSDLAYGNSDVLNDWVKLRLG